MVDEFLNQDEIDALLSGTSNSDGESGGGAVAGGGNGSLSRDDISALNEVVGIVASAASNVIGMLAGRDVTTSIGDQEELPQNSARGKVDAAKVFSYSMTLAGLDSAPTRLITTERGALALADLMMGGDAKDLPAEANDLYLSAAQEGLSQLIGSVLTNLSGIMGGAKLSADSASSSLDDAETWIPFTDEADDSKIWLGKIELTVEGVEPFTLNITMPVANAAMLAAKVREAMAPPEEEPAPAQSSALKAASKPQASVAARPAQQVSLPPRPQSPPVDARPVEFAQLGGSEFAGSPGNIDLIVDIPVRVTVELGRTRKTIGEVLALGPGSVVELNKMAGEPVDVLVNGKLIARGEVVVIDESFGIRVTEVVSKAERIRSMGV